MHPSKWSNKDAAKRHLLESGATVRVLWDSAKRGTYNVGRNKTKRERKQLFNQWR